MSARSGIEVVVRLAAGNEVPEVLAEAAFADTAPPKAPTLRLHIDDDFAVDNEATAAAAEGPLLRGGGTLSRRALRSSRESVVAAETARFLEREIFGAIAMNDSSEHRVSF